MHNDRHDGDGDGGAASKPAVHFVSELDATLSLTEAVSRTLISYC